MLWTFLKYKKIKNKFFHFNLIDLRNVLYIFQVKINLRFHSYISLIKGTGLMNHFLVQQILQFLFLIVIIVYYFRNLRYELTGHSKRKLKEEGIPDIFLISDFESYRNHHSSSKITKVRNQHNIWFFYFVNGWVSFEK